MKNLFVAITLFLSSFVLAQTRIGDFSIASYSHSKLSKSDVRDFKNSTTYFVINNDLGLFQAQFESVLNKVWSITPFKVIIDKDLNQNLSEENSYARFNSFSVTREGNLTTSTSSYIVFDFFMPKNLKKTKKGNYKWKPRRLAAVYFTLDVSGRKDVVAQKTKVGGDLMNYRLGYIKNTFQEINNKIAKMKSKDIYEDFVNKPELKKLKYNKLYFDDSLIYGYNPFAIKDKESYTKEDLFENYSYEYEFISSDALNDKILNSEEDFYYLMYNQINSNKILTIINGKTGEAIFQEHKKMSFNLKPKDIKQLNNTLAKLK